MSLRAIQDRARRQLHARMAVPAVYVPPGLLPVSVPCTVRPHERTKQFGDLSGFDFAPAERIESVPEIVALAEEVDPRRGGIFSISPGRAYRVEVVLPVDGITVTSQVTLVTDPAILAGLPLPTPEA